MKKLLFAVLLASLLLAINYQATYFNPEKKVVAKMVTSELEELKPKEKMKETEQSDLGENVVASDEATNITEEIKSKNNGSAIINQESQKSTQNENKRHVENNNVDSGNNNNLAGNLKPVETPKNCISIPNVCSDAVVTEGSSQTAVDKNDICLMTQIASSFGQGRPILLGGHSTRSLNGLHRSQVGDIITVSYDGNTYKYKVEYSDECYYENYDLFDKKTGELKLERRTRREVLQIYTCYGLGTQNRWLVKAIRI